MEERIVKAYYRYMVDIAVMFGANRDLATEDLRKSLEFEMNLAKVSVCYLYLETAFQNVASHL